LEVLDRTLGRIAGATDVARPVLLVLAALVGLLVAATAFRLFVLRRADRDVRRQRLRSLFTWWVLVALFVGAVLSGTGFVVGLFALGGALGLREEFASRRDDRRAPSQRIILGLGLVVVYAGLLAGGLEGWLAAGFLSLAALPASLVPSDDPERFPARAGELVLAFLLVVLLPSHAAALVAAPPAENPTAGPLGWLILLLLLTEGNDVAQAQWGRALGRTKLAPNLSPGKTRIGLAGGLATTAAAGALLGPFLAPLSAPVGAFAGLAVGVAGIFGDLTMSGIKRDRGLDDSGTTLPGQGGVLDRIDSLALTAPLWYWGVRLLGGAG
jgi:phosphatidate cytidylyltransferase